MVSLIELREVKVINTSLKIHITQSLTFPVRSWEILGQTLWIKICTINILKKKSIWKCGLLIMWTPSFWRIFSIILTDKLFCFSIFALMKYVLNYNLILIFNNPLSGRDLYVQNSQSHLGSSFHTTAIYRQCVNTCILQKRNFVSHLTELKIALQQYSQLKVRQS